MEFNLPTNVRFAIYILTSLAGILLTYLSATGQISQDAMTAFSATVIFVAGLAGYNVKR
jgi:hypothetical protein